MASLWKRHNSKFFTACFTATDGRQLKRSTKTNDRKLAWKLALEWEAAAQKTMTESQARRVIGDLYQMINGDTLEKATVREFVDRWLATKKVETSSVTFQKYSQISRQFLEFLGRKAEGEISSISVKELTAFRDSLVTKVSPVTINIALKVIGTLFAKAYRDGLIDSNPAPKVQRIAQREKEVEKRAFTVPELQRILACCNGEWRGMVLCGLYFGQRLKDIATLTWRNIDLEHQGFRLSSGKTRRRVLIPLAKPVFAYFKARPLPKDQGEPLFPEAHAVVKRAKRGTAATLSGQFYAIMTAAGLVPKRSHHSVIGKGRSGKRAANEIGFHALRHTATSMMKNAGINSATVQDLIGHESSAVSAVYTHIDEPAKRRAIESLPDITR